MKKTLSIWSPRPDAEAKTAIAPDIFLYGLPAIEIVEKPLNQSAQQRLADAEVLIFVSQYAVKHSFSGMSPTVFEQTSHKILVAIGLRTAEALQQYNLTATIIAPPPFNSEALLQDETFLNLPFQRVAIICGVGGRMLLHTSLRQLGKQVQRIECYQRDKANLSAQVMVEFITEQAIGGIILSSNTVAEAVTKHVSMTEQQCFTLPVFVFSRRIAKRAKQLGFREIIVAEQADKESLYRSIINWWKGRLP